MKINDILKPFCKQLKDFMNEKEGKEQEPDSFDISDSFFFIFGDTYIHVDPELSYWYEEDDGTIVYRINELDLDICQECEHLYTCDNNWEGDGEFQLIECNRNR